MSWTLPGGGFWLNLSLREDFGVCSILFIYPHYVAGLSLQT